MIMLRVKELLAKILTAPTGENLGTLVFPYTVPKTGVLTINLPTRNIGSTTGAYYYLRVNDMTGYQCTWNGIANGGQASMTIAVKKGDVLTGMSNNVNNPTGYLYPYWGGVLPKGIFCRRKVVAVC